MDLKALPELLTRSKFCELTGIPARTVDWLRATGRLRAWRIPGGSRHLYPKSEVARLLESGYATHAQSPSAVPPAPASVHAHAST